MSININKTIESLKFLEKACTLAKDKVVYDALIYLLREERVRRGR